MAGTFPELEGKTLLVCVGAMRCGTSWLYHYLAELDGVAVSPIKEIHFFNAKFPSNALGDMDALALRRLGLHAERNRNSVEKLRETPAVQASIDRAQMIYDDTAYFGHLARISAPETTTLCDITPAYAVIGEAGFRYMRSFVSDRGLRPKILFILRDPVERLWSQLRHMQHLNPAAEAAARWREALKSPPIMARADYRATIEDLDAVFAPEDICRLFYEDLFCEPALRRLCDFVGAPYRPGRSDMRPNAGVIEQDLPADARQAFLEALAPQYAYCRERFGDVLPESWAGW